MPDPVYSFNCKAFLRNFEEKKNKEYNEIKLIAQTHLSLLKSLTPSFLRFSTFVLSRLLTFCFASKLEFVLVFRVFSRLPLFLFIYLFFFALQCV